MCGTKHTLVREI